MITAKQNWIKTIIYKLLRQKFHSTVLNRLNSTDTISLKCTIISHMYKNSVSRICAGFSVRSLHDWFD